MLIVLLAIFFSEKSEAFLDAGDLLWEIRSYFFPVDVEFWG